MAIFWFEENAITIYNYNYMIRILNILLAE